MSFIESCITSVLAIDGYQTIYYGIYCLIGQKFHTVSSESESSTPGLSQALVAAEDAASILHTRNALATFSSESAFLWIFGNTKAASAASLAFGKNEHIRGEAVRIGDTEWKCSGAGDVNISQLQQAWESFSMVHASANGWVGSPSSAENNSHINIPKGKSRSAQLVDDEADLVRRTLALLKIYKMYKSAWISLVSRQFRQQLQMFPVDKLTYAIRSNRIDAKSGLQDLDGRFMETVGLSLDISANGSILASVASQSLIEAAGRLHDDKKIYHSKVEGQNIIMGPCNKLAVALPHVKWDQSIPNSIFENGVPLRIGNIDWWKSMIQRKMELRAVHLSELADDDSWISIAMRISSSVLDLHDDRATKSKFLNVLLLWPKDLCFRVTPLGHETDSDQFSTMSHFTASLDYSHEVVQYNGPRIELSFALQSQSIDFQDHDLQQEPQNTFLEQSQPNLAPQAGELIPNSQTLAAIYPTPPDLLPVQTSPESHCEPTLTFQTMPVAIETEQTSPVALMDDTSMTTEQLPEDGAQRTYTNESDDELFGPEGNADPDFSFFDVSDDEKDDVMKTDPVLINATKQGSPDKKDSPGNLMEIEKGTRMEDDESDLKKNDDIFATRNDSLGNERFVESSNIMVIEPDPGAASTPPLSPLAVKTQLSSGLDGTSEPLDFLKSVTFSTELNDSDKKYSGHGRFVFRSGNKKEKNSTSESFPAAGAAERHRLSKTKVGMSASVSSPSAVSPGNRIIEDDQSDDSGESFSSNDKIVGSRGINTVDQSYDVSTVSSGNVDEAQMHDADSDVKEESEQSEEEAYLYLNEKQTFQLLIHLLDSRPSNLDLQESIPLNRPGLEIQEHFKPSSDTDELIEVAQILAEQICYSTIGNCPVPPSDIFAHSIKPYRLKQLELHDMYSLIGDEVSTARQLDVPSLLTFPNTLETENIKQTERLASKGKEKQFRKTAMTTSLDGEDRLLKLQCPQICLQKTESLWEFLPSAIGFWEVLGLGATNGAKRVLAYCIFPNQEHSEETVKYFLKTMTNLWRTYKLGTHFCDDTSKDYASGLVKYEKSKLSLPLTDLTKIEEACINLGQHLGDRELNLDAVVIYIVNPSSNPQILQSLCNCFSALRQAYSQSTQHMTKRFGAQNIVLKVVSTELLEGQDGVGTLNPETGFNLAREIYDRCSGDNKENLNESYFMPSSCSIELAERPPKAIVFHLTAGEAQNIVHETPCMHVSYSRGQTGTWISAAWTDNIGRNQNMRSYCCSGNCTFDDIAGEIWETTLEIIRARKVKWQIFLVKSEPMDKIEKLKWIRIVEKSKSVSFEATIISLNTKPVISVIKPFPSTAETSEEAVAGASKDTATAQYSSPGPSTPLANLPTIKGSSASLINPIESYNAMDADATARLVDITDEAWGMVFSQPLNVSSSANLNAHIATASGYLLKRVSDDDYDPLAVLEVNIMYNTQLTAEANSKPGSTSSEVEARTRQKRYEGLVREVLVMYRGLVLLARVRGLAGVESTKPWHVAVAMNGARALDRYMRI